MPRVPQGHFWEDDTLEEFQEVIKVEDTEKWPDQESSNKNDQKDKKDPVTKIHQSPECDYTSPKIFNMKSRAKKNVTHTVTVLS